MAPPINISTYEGDDVLFAHLASHINTYLKYFPGSYLPNIDEQNTFQHSIFSHDRKTISAFVGWNCWFRDQSINENAERLLKKISEYQGRFMAGIFLKLLKNEITLEQLLPCEKIQFILNINETSSKNVEEGRHWSTLAIEVDFPPPDLVIRKLLLFLQSNNECANPTLNSVFANLYHEIIKAEPPRASNNIDLKTDQIAVALGNFWTQTSALSYKIRHYDSYLSYTKNLGMDNKNISALWAKALGVIPEFPPHINCSQQAGNVCCEHTALNSFMAAAFGHGAVREMGTSAHMFSSNLRGFTSRFKESKVSFPATKREFDRSNFTYEPTLSDQYQASIPSLDWLNHFLGSNQKALGCSSSEPPHQQETARENSNYSSSKPSYQEEIWEWEMVNTLERYLILLRKNIDRMPETIRKTELNTLCTLLTGALRQLHQPTLAIESSSNEIPPSKYKIFFDACHDAIEAYKKPIEEHQTHPLVRVLIKILDFFSFLLLGVGPFVKYHYSKDKTGAPYFFNFKTRTQEICGNILEKAHELELQSQVKPTH